MISSTRSLVLPANNHLESQVATARARLFFALTLVLVTLAELGYAYRHSDFNNDDLDHFALAAKSSLLAYMMTPVETIHIVPFHRLLTYLVYRIAPMNFTVALTLLGCIQLVTLYYLCRISRLLQAGIFGYAIVLCYALSVLNIYAFVWWASAAHRIPYLALSACVTYHYLASLREKHVRHHWMIAVIAFVIGCGFYIKMVFVPFYLVAYGLVAFGISGGAGRRALSLPAMLACGSLVYLLTYTHFVHADHAGHAGIGLTLQVSSEYLLALFCNLLGFTIDNDFVHTFGMFNIRTIGVLGVWLAVLIWTLQYGKRIAMCWLLLLTITFVDFVPIAMSYRTLYFFDLVPYLPRYHVDAQVIVAVLLLIIAAGVTSQSANRQLGARRALALCLVTFFTAAELINFQSSITQRALGLFNFAHAYMRHLRRDLKQIHDPYPSFVISPIPEGMDLFGDIHSSNLIIPLFRPKGRFDVDRGDYLVQMDGHIIPTGSVR